MTTYYVAKARNERTKQTVKHQDLTGRLYQRHELAELEEQADAFALQMTKRSGELWIGFTEAYQK